MATASVDNMIVDSQPIKLELYSLPDEMIRGIASHLLTNIQIVGRDSAIAVIFTDVFNVKDNNTKDVSNDKKAVTLYDKTIDNKITTRWQRIDEKSGIILDDQEIKKAYEKFEQAQEDYEFFLRAHPDLGSSMILRPVFPLSPTEETIKGVKNMIELGRVSQRCHNVVLMLLKVRGLNPIVLWCQAADLEEKRALEETRQWVEQANKRRKDRYGYTPLSTSNT
jgi:hypothetical protein